MFAKSMLNLEKLPGLYIRGCVLPNLVAMLPEVLN